MLRFTLSSTLLLAAACLLVTAVSSERVIACENNVLRLSCGMTVTCGSLSPRGTWSPQCGTSAARKDDHGVIGVQDALYGRADRETCSQGRPRRQLANTDCSQEGAVDVLRTRCDGKKVCELDTDVVGTPDPCSGTFKYLDTNYTCNPAFHLVACERTFAHLFCGVGQVISVYGADYGRRDRTTCSFKRPNGQINNDECYSPTTRVAERCNGRNSCVIEASNSEFGDPCEGTFKYLEVAYTCDYPVFNPDESPDH